MKKFETMSELYILQAARETILDRWDHYYSIVELNGDNETAKYYMQLYRGMLNELESEIIPLVRSSKLNKLNSGGQLLDGPKTKSF